MKQLNLKPNEATQRGELLMRMQHRLAARSYPKRELQRFVEMFLIASEELDEMRGEASLQGN